MVKALFIGQVKRKKGNAAHLVEILLVPANERVEINTAMCSWPLSVTSGEEPSHFLSQTSLIFTSFPCFMPLSLREAALWEFGISCPRAAGEALVPPALRQKMGCTDTRGKSQAFLLSSGLLHLYLLLLLLPISLFHLCLFFIF